MSYTETPVFSMHTSSGRLKGLKNAEEFREYLRNNTGGSKSWLFLLNDQRQAEAHHVFIEELGLPDLCLDIDTEELIENIDLPDSNGLVLIRQEMRLRRGEELGHAVCFLAQAEDLAS